MKTCYSCKLSKQHSEFGKNKARVDGLQSLCKLCDNARAKKYYRVNEKQRVETRKRSALRKKRLQDQICLYLSEHPCVDCGEKDIVVLEFDHEDPKSKVSTVANLLNAGNSWKDIALEISKCIVRCANCHRRRTARQFGSYKITWTSSSNGRASV